MHGPVGGEQRGDGQAQGPAEDAGRDEQQAVRAHTWRHSTDQHTMPVGQNEPFHNTARGRAAWVPMPRALTPGTITAIAAAAHQPLLHVRPQPRCITPVVFASRAWRAHHPPGRLCQRRACRCGCSSQLRRQCEQPPLHCMCITREGV